MDQIPSGALFGGEIVIVRTVYTEGIVREYQTGFWDYCNQRRRNMWTVAIVLLSVSALLSLMSGGIRFGTLFLLLSDGLCIFLFYRERANAAQQGVDAVREAFPNQPPTVLVELGSIITIFPPRGGFYQIPYGQLVDYFETERLLVLVMRDGMIIPLAKYGFQRGNLQGCRYLLREKLGR